MKRVNISLTDEDHRRLELAARKAHNSKKRMAELYVMRGLVEQPADAKAEIDPNAALLAACHSALAFFDWKHYEEISDRSFTRLDDVVDELRAALAPFEDVKG